MTAVRVPVDVYPGGASDDDVVVEEPLELVVEDRSLGVLMRTPGHDVELAIGWLLAEGVIDDRDDVAACATTAANTVRVRLADGIDPRRLDAAARERFASSACGVCGRAALDRAPPPRPAPPDLDPRRLLALADRLRAAQPLFLATGGAHAAALVDPSGALAVVREDVGRHNAVDKVAGWAVLADRAPARGAWLLVSSRAGYEIVQKAAALGVDAVVAVGAATSLAVAFAAQQRLGLVGFLRDGRFTRYS